MEQVNTTLPPTPPVAPTPAPVPSPKKTRWGKIYIGIFLIVIGGLFLAENFGWLSLSWDWSRVWPLLIIFAGLSLLAGHNRVTQVLSMILLFCAIGFFSVLSVRPWSAQVSVSDDIDVALPTEAAQSDISVNYGASEVTIDSREGNFISGEMKSYSGVDLTQKQEGATAFVTIAEKKSEGVWFMHMGWPARKLSLHVPVALPTALHLDTGASTVNVDARKIQLTKLDVDAGASTLDIILGDLVARAEVTVDAGASTIHLTVPRSLGVQVEINGGLSTKHMGDLKAKGENMYVSENYDSAEKKADVVITSGVSTIDVVRD